MTITVGGQEMEPILMRSALLRFAEERPFLSGLRYNSTRAEIRYWDEAPDALTVLELAAEVWQQHQTSANLPPWEVLGLEVVDRPIQRERTDPDPVPGGKELKVLGF